MNVTTVSQVNVFEQLLEIDSWLGGQSNLSKLEILKPLLNDYTKNQILYTLKANIMDGNYNCF